MVVMWALSKGMVVNPREYFGGITHPRAIVEALTAVILASVVRKARGDKPSPYRYGWILAVMGMFLFPFVSLARSSLVATLFFILWYYLVIWTFSWEAAPKNAKTPISNYSSPTYEGETMKRWGLVFPILYFFLLFLMAFVFNSRGK